MYVAEDVIKFTISGPLYKEPTDVLKVIDLGLIQSTGNTTIRFILTKDNNLRITFNNSGVWSKTITSN